MPQLVVEIREALASGNGPQGKLTLRSLVYALQSVERNAADSIDDKFLKQILDIHGVELVNGQIDNLIS